MAWPIPKVFKKALAWFKGALGLTEQAQQEIEDRCARRAKVAACAAQLRMVQMVYEASQRGEAAGGDFDAWKADLVQVLRQGWSPDGYRTALVFDVAVQRGYAQGRVRAMLLKSVRKIWPYWMFEAVQDERTGFICDALHGVIRPAAESWWERRSPPLHPRCRSHIRGLSSDEAHRRGVTWWYPEPSAEAGWGALDEEYVPSPEGVPPELWAIFARATADS